MTERTSTMIEMQAATDRAKQQAARESVPFRVHPRVFAALGADLVTNDIVAVIELVKNSYDAFAHNVRIEFGKGSDGTPYLEIRDDGMGMTREVIENSWCTVATPHKETHQLVRKEGRVRRVVGNKGLGRLSAARLGNRLVMLTQAPQLPCWEVSVNWSEVAAGDDIALSAVILREGPEISPFVESGTSLRILELREQWDEDRVRELAENLGRLISPFAEQDEFNITLSGTGKAGTIGIEAPLFLSEPKYSIKGTVDTIGNISGTYEFAPIGTDGVPRTAEMSQTWSQIHGSTKDSWKFPHSSESASCGPFAFDIRAWDINASGTGEIYEKYGVQRSLVRRAISTHKGISVYRDGVLTLPKSEGARDWLGLDLRRVSQVGRRLSTSQLVGYISISAEDNSKIEDTSDRERLSMCAEVEEFEEIIRSIVGLLASGRNQDREEQGREQPMAELLDALSAEQLVSDTTELAESGAQASAVVPLVRKFDESLGRSRRAIETRFIYYSRLATVGTIAQMLVHEIRNRTTAIGAMLKLVKEEYGPFGKQRVVTQFSRADFAVSALEKLADTFAPLASRNFRRGRRRSVLEERIRNCLSLHEEEIQSKNVQCSFPESQTVVAVDPGELDTIILNLIMNALYWLEKEPREQRSLEFGIEPTDDHERTRVSVHDTGPGIDHEDVEKVFWPGVTRRPDGIGMGLTIASELVAAYGGRMGIIEPSLKGGASFEFDLPWVKTGERTQ